jgi:dTDP-4-dehydrorhamnose reductase
MKIAVVGARGQLGAAVVDQFTADHEVVPLTHEELDVTVDDDVAAAMSRLRPHVIINCAAMNDVDGAEDRPIEALNANAFAVRALARAALDLDATLVHFSTDFVFDGTASTPYTETDSPNPLSAYAMSKLLGEWFAEDAANVFVLRVESLFGRAAGGRPAKGSVAGILKALLAGDELRVFEDRTISPTYIMDAAWATRRLLDMQAPYGMYHCVNSGQATWLELAKELARQLGVAGRIVPVRLKDMALRAERPVFCALSNEKLARLGIVMPSWQDALGRYLLTARDDFAHQLSNR